LPGKHKALSSKPSATKKTQKNKKSWALVAHACNPSYSRKRQKSGGSWFEASPGKWFARPYLGKPFTKIGLVEW
jgi:hypothetical protein